MKQKLIFIFILLFFTYSLFSQKNNSIQFNIGALLFTQSHASININQWGVQYSRRITNKINLSLTYNKWTTWNDSFLPRQEGVFYNNCWYSSNLKECEHELTVRKNFKMLDLSFLYSLYSRKKIGNLNVGSGISYAWGNNSYIDTVILPTIPPYDNIDYTWRHENGKYIGIVPMVDYSYNFWKNRLSIGTSFKARKYFGLKDTQFDWIFHVGYNF